MYESSTTEVSRTDGNTCLNEIKQRRNEKASILGCNCEGFHGDHTIPPNTLYLACTCKKTHYMKGHIPSTCVHCAKELNSSDLTNTSDIPRYNRTWEIFVDMCILDDNGKIL